MLLAQRNAGGWLPLQALLHTKLVRAALKAKHPALDLRDAQACHQLLVLDQECEPLTQLLWSRGVGCHQSPLASVADLTEQKPCQLRLCWP